MNGIDVSHHQGVIDWDAVKASGVQFAILRAGYGREMSQIDRQWERNYTECKRLGIPVGAYWYVYADDVAEGLQEVECIKHALAGKQLELPVYLDVEDKLQVAMGSAACTKMVDAMASALESAGYFVGVYSYASFFRYNVNFGELSEKYTIWLADYRSNYDKQLTRDMHQHTSSGKVAGISTNVDMDTLHRDDLPEIIKGAGLNGWKKEVTPAPQPQPKPRLREITVGPMTDGDYNTIRAAIDAACAPLGVTVKDKEA